MGTNEDRGCFTGEISEVLQNRQTFRPVSFIEANTAAPEERTCTRHGRELLTKNIHVKTNKTLYHPQGDFVLATCPECVVRLVAALGDKQEARERFDSLDDVQEFAAIVAAEQWPPGKSSDDGGPWEICSLDCEQHPLHDVRQEFDTANIDGEFAMFGDTANVGGPDGGDHE